MMIVIGIDCSTDPKKLGLALSRYDGGMLTVTEARVAGREDPADIVAEWLSGADGALLCFDAPLGWPSALGSALVGHVAGGPISAKPNRMFARDCDRFIHRKLKKKPLDVGADRIARTARSALELLARVRNLSGYDIPLAWTPGFDAPVAAIEVYPAATLLAHGFSDKDYKGATEASVEARLRVLMDVRTRVDIDVDEDLLVQNVDALDAVICCLAGGDFLAGRAMPPDDMQVAVKEGWIWAREPRRQ